MARVHLFGIGSKKWQKDNAVTVNERGVPMNTNRSKRKLVATKPPPTIKFSVTDPTYAAQCKKCGRRYVKGRYSAHARNWHHG